MNGAESLKFVVRTGAPPNDLILKVAAPGEKNAIDDELEIVACGRIAMEIKTASRLQYALDFSDAKSDAHEIGKETAFLEYERKAFDEVNRPRRKASIGIVDDLVKTGARKFIPAPCIGEGLCLGKVLNTNVVIDLVVISFGVERRVDIAKINSFVLDTLAENFEVVAVKESIFDYRSKRENITLTVLRPQSGYLRNVDSVPFQELRGWPARPLI